LLSEETSVIEVASTVIKKVKGKAIPVTGHGGP
jgi:hypothetical protein